MRHKCKLFKSARRARLREGTGTVLSRQTTTTLSATKRGRAAATLFPREKRLVDGAAGVDPRSCRVHGGGAAP
jgi:hypothetical protein